MPISCTPQDLVTAARAFYDLPDLDAIEIMSLCIMAGGTIPTQDTVFGNPTEEFMFGNPDADFVFGVPP